MLFPLLVFRKKRAPVELLSSQLSTGLGQHLCCPHLSSCSRKLSAIRIIVLKGMFFLPGSRWAGRTTYYSRTKVTTCNWRLGIFVSVTLICFHKERRQGESKKLALGLSNGDGNACNSRTNSGGPLVFTAFRELGDVVPCHIWVSQLLLKTKSSSITGEQGNNHSELWCSQVQSSCAASPRSTGECRGRRGRLITPTAQVWGWTKEISLSACERDKECK